MADGNHISANPDFFDEQAHDFLPLRHIEGVGARPESASELGQRFTEAQITGLIDGGGVDGLPLGRDGLLLRAERGHPGP